MTTNIGKFRKQLDLLMNHLEECIPRDKEIEKHQLKLETAMKANPRGTIETFIDAISPYTEQILLGNDSYFTDKTSEDLGVVSDYVSFSNKLKSIWNQLTEAQKGPVRRYIKLLVMLGIIVTRNEPLRQIINKHRPADNPLMF